MTSSKELFERFESVAGPKHCVLREWGAAWLDGSEVLARTSHWASLLEREGVGSGDLVLLKGISGASLVVGLLAVWSRDAAALAAESTLSAAEVESLCEDFAPACLLTSGAGGAPMATRTASRSRRTLPPGTAVIKLTSGSTGRPRGIAVGAAHLIADGRQILRGMGIGADDVNLGVIPPAHSYGLGNLVMTLVLQGSPLLLLRDPLPATLSSVLSLPEPCIFPGVPALFEMLVRLPEKAMTPKGLRLCISAGAPLRPDTAAAFRGRFGLPVRSLYGASECGGITYDASPDGTVAETGDGAVGLPLPEVEVRLSGEEGRVTARSRAVAFGYLSVVEAEGDGEFSEGWFRTGDTGRFDAQGRLVLTGRIGALVNVAGRKVNPREVETVLLSVPGVGDAAVLGVPDAARGEALVACLVPQGELSRELVMSYLRQELAGYKLPRRLVFMESIPRNERGKLNRGALLRAAQGSDSPELKN
ncbi:MAG: acyl--CoA ligase [Acidobacteria bacterium]|nr:acyl--CoA ligase [Acidobacteriota bacterium]